MLGYGLDALEETIPCLRVIGLGHQPVEALPEHDRAMVSPI
jgi:hypothetical protein